MMTIPTPATAIHCNVNAYQWNPYMGEHTSRQEVEVPRAYFHQSHRISQKHYHQQPAMKSNLMASATASYCSSQAGETNSLSNSVLMSSLLTPEQQISPRATPPPASTLDADGFAQSYESDPICPAVALPQFQFQKPVANSPARNLLRVCLAQPNDAMVGTKICSLDTQSLKMLFALLLEEAPELIKNLFLKERGNVVVQLFSIPCAAEFHHELDTLFQHVTCLYPILAVDKQGALALTRLYENVSLAGTYRHTLDALTLDHFDAIVCHPFGNFLVSHAVRNLNSASPDNRNAIIGIFSDPTRFVQICSDKFGAHTTEAWVRHSGNPELGLTLRRLVNLPGAVFHMADHVTGNNALQRIASRMNRIQTAEQGEAGNVWKESRDAVLAQCQGATFQRMVVASINRRSMRK